MLPFVPQQDLCHLACWGVLIVRKLGNERDET